MRKPHIAFLTKPCTPLRPRTPDTTQFVTFAIGDDQCGIAVMAVITHLPKQADYGRGMLDLRSVKMSIIDLRCRLSHGLTQATPMYVVIIVQVEAQPIGLLGDRVSDGVPVDTANIQRKIEQSPAAKFRAVTVGLVFRTCPST